MTIEADDDERRRLVKEMHNTALAKLKLYFKQYQAGEIKVGVLLESARHLNYPREVLVETGEQGIELTEQFRDFCQLLESMAKERFEKKTGSETDWLEAKYARLAAANELLSRPFLIGEPVPAEAGIPIELDPAENTDLSLEQVITSQSGTFKRDGLPDAPIIEVSFVTRSETNATLKRLADIKTIRSLYPTGPGVTDEGLQHLRVQSELESLVLNSPNITDAGTKEFAAFPS